MIYNSSFGGFMRWFAAFAFAALAALIFWPELSSHAPRVINSAPSAPAAQPIYGWRQLTQTDFALSPDEYREAEQFTRVPNNARIRLAMTADAPVTFGFEVIPPTSEADHTARMVCDASRVFSAAPECNIEAGSIMRLKLRDARNVTAADAALGTAALLLGRNAKPMQDATATNRASLTMFEWQCISNCPQK